MATEDRRERKAAKNQVAKIAREFGLTRKGFIAQGRVGDLEGLNRACLSIEALVRRNEWVVEAELGRFLGDPWYTTVKVGERDAVGILRRWIAEADDNAIVAVQED